MATGVQVWSQTAATNASVDTNINFAEGMAPSQVNDSSRAAMASVAKWRDDNNGTLITSGSTTAFTLATGQVEGALTAGYTVAMTFHATSDTSATLAVDGLAAKPLQCVPGTNLVGGEFQAGAIGSFTYSSTGTGQWIANRAPAQVGTGNLQASGVTAAKIATGAITLPKYATTAGNPGFGFDMPINLQINASVGSSILTIALKTNSGADPSAADPIYIPFRDTTIANGDPVWVTISSALSMTTNAAGATLATQNNVPFRFWIVAFNNGGTAVLALWHSGAGAATTAINPLNEGVLQSTTAISAAATSAGVFYTPNGTTLTNKAFRIIGYLDYSSGLATAGTYSAVPTILQLFGPGINKPGNVIQTVSVTGATSAAITPTSAANLIKINSGTQVTGSNAVMGAALKRGSTTLISNASQSSATFAAVMVSLGFLDNPATASSVSYSLAGSNGSANASDTFFVIDEVMA